MNKNIEHYPDDLDITAIDFSEKILVRVNGKAMSLNKKENFMQMNAQNLKFPYNSFRRYLQCVK